MTWWWKTPHNIEIFRKAHVFRPGDPAIVKGYCINDHPDRWIGSTGQFSVPDWSRCYVVDIARQGCPDEFVKVVLTDKRGRVASGWVGRWTPQAGNCNVWESIKYLEEHHAIATEQGTDHQASGRSGRRDQGQDPAHSRDSE